MTDPAHMTRDELAARIKAIDDAMMLPGDWTSARDALNTWGSQISEAEWWRAAIIFAIAEPPEEEKRPEWFIPTPSRKTYPPVRLLPAEPLLPPGVTPWIPDTEEGAKALLGILGEFVNYTNWLRAATVHALIGPPPEYVSGRTLSGWYITGITKPQHAAALFDSWHRAIMKGKAAPAELGAHFELPDMAYPHPIQRIVKKPLTAAQKRAKRAGKSRNTGSRAPDGSSWSLPSR